MCSSWQKTFVVLFYRWSHRPEDRYYVKTDINNEDVDDNDLANDMKVFEKGQSGTCVACWPAFLIMIMLLVCITTYFLIINFAVVQQLSAEKEKYEMQRIYPNLPKSLIIGARKCGTRALLDFINLHPDVSTAREEIHFFDKEKNFERGLSWYSKQMPRNTQSATSQFTLEKSPAYFVTQEAAARVHAMNSSLRLLLILRDPVWRVVSDYAQITQNKLKRGKPLSTLEDLVLDSHGRVRPDARMIRTSFYLTHVRRWLNYFRPSQLLAVDGDILVNRPLDEMRLVENFLGLRPHLTQDNFVFNSSKGFYCYRRTSNDAEHCLGEDKGRRYPILNSTTLAKLRDFFQPQDSRLRILLRRNFLWMKYDM